MVFGSNLSLTLTLTWCLLIIERQFKLYFNLSAYSHSLIKFMDVIPEKNQHFNHCRHAQNDLLNSSDISIANGPNQTPTAIDLDKTLLKDFLFNQSCSRICINTTCKSKSTILILPRFDSIFFFFPKVH